MKKERNKLRILKKQLNNSTCARVAYSFLIMELVKHVEHPEEIFRQFTAKQNAFGRHIQRLAELLDIKL